jgi:CubicO group peptidase (beta-lactamase class C family)
VALLLLGSVPAAAAEPNQEAIAKAWVAAHNAGEEAMAAFRADHFKRSEVTDWRMGFQRMREELGRLEIYGIMLPEEHVVLVGVRNDDGRLRLRFRFFEDAPDQIREIMADDAEGGPGRAGSGLPPLDLDGDWGERRGQIDAWLAGLAERDLFSGSVLVVERGEKRFEGAYGLASREYGAPNTLRTRFDVGSFNKDYTRLGILQLMLAGQLSLDDTVGRHLPDYPNEDVRERVTLQQLIDHTAGLGDYFDDDWWKTPMGGLREIDDYIPIWGPKPLIGEPGERERYSNFGYTVLGAIIEKLSGMSYPDYVVERIFKPAGMHDSGFFEVDEIVPDVATGYTKLTRQGDQGTLRRNTFFEPARGGPWGKSYSTAEDLYRFFAAMFAGEFLPPQHNWLAAGWDAGGIGLAGGGPGLNAELFLEDGWMVIVMANLDPPVAGRVAQSLHRAIR